MKGSLFIPTPNDINWLNVRNESDGFINQPRYFASNTFQKSKEVEVAEIASNQEQERANSKISGEHPKTQE